MSWFVTLWAIFAGGFTWVAVYRLFKANRATQSRKVRVRRRPRVLLLRPVDAPTPLELQNLDARIDYSGELSHVVLSPFRPRLTSANVRWLPSDPLTSNRKVGHVAYALATLPEARDAVVLCVDADVKVDGALVSALVEQLQDGAALASAPPRPEVVDSFAGRVARGLLVQSHHSSRVAWRAGSSCSRTTPSKRST
jgi:ceramide glucosyltransferase